LVVEVGFQSLDRAGDLAADLYCVNRVSVPVAETTAVIGPRLTGTSV
jgi:hypothetical protein